MKKNIEILFCLIALLSCILMPAVVINGMSTGIKLFLFTIIPAFFPFLFLSEYMNERNISLRIGNLLSPVFCRLFSCSPAGAYCIFMGFLCGYPMGAITVSQAYKSGSISRKEACYLLGFCNNASPMFLSGYFLTACFPHHPYSAWQILVIFYLPPFLASVCLRILYRQHAVLPAPSSHKCIPEGKAVTVEQLFMRSFYTLLKLGGYILLFSVLASFCHACLWKIPAAASMVPAIMEITSGLALLSVNEAFIPFFYPYACASMLFGGLSCMFQTAGVLKDTDLPLLPYTAGKILQFLFGFFLACRFL